MKYKIIAIIVIVVFVILYLTRNVNAQVIENGTPPSEMYKPTATIADESDRGCVVYEYDHAVGKNFLPLQRVVCRPNSNLSAPTK